MLSTITVLGVALSMTSCGGGGGSNATKTSSSTNEAIDYIDAAVPRITSLG